MYIIKKSTDGGKWWQSRWKLNPLPPSCPQRGFSAALPTSDLNNQWNLSWYEFLKPRSTEKVL